MEALLRLPLALLLSMLAGCDDEPSDSTTPDASDLHDADTSSGEDAAVGDPIDRHQPPEPIDADNVVDYDEDLEILDLPPPPTSGFRIVVPPRDLDPGDEVTACVSWPMPDVTNRVIYAARLYTTPGLHHSNVIAVPEHEEGPQPYPRCLPGSSDPFERINDGVIPDVLFANSTQIEGVETLVFPEGYGFRVDTADEIVTSLHLLNPTSDTERNEIVYDFFTMPEAELTDEVAPFLMDVNHFQVDVGETADVGGACNVFGGELVALMPHTHRFAVDFVVETLAAESVVDVIYQGGAFDLESDIALFDPPLPLEGIDQLRYHCTFRNTSDHGIVRGIGDDEMCILFGYVTPTTSQFVGQIANEDGQCLSLPIGQGL